MPSSIPLFIASASLVVSFCALLVTSFQLFTIRRNAQRQMRAYLGVLDHKISDVAEGQRPRLQISVKNFGQTPARKVQYWLHSKLDEYPLQNNLPERPFRSERIVLFPTDGTTPTFELADPFNAADMAGLQSGNRRLYVYGQIRYTDAFDHDRNTYFRLMYGGSLNMSLGRLVWAETGNDQD